MRISLIVATVLSGPTLAHAEPDVATPLPTGVDLGGVWGTGRHVFVVGDVGTILTSTDDGKTWKQLATKTRVALRAIWGSGLDDIYIVGDGNLVLHSTDGGATWNETNPPTHVTTGLYTVWGIGASDVYVAGVNGALAQSTDRGKTWRSLNVEGKLSYKTIYGLVGTKPGADIFAVGEGGAMWQRANGTWLGGGGGSTGLRAIAPLGDGFVAVGEQGRIVLLDATGHSHEVKTSADRILRGVYGFRDLAVAVGEVTWSQSGGRATLLRSTDAGKTWAPIDSAAAHHLSAIWGDARALWAVGEAGEIVRSTDDGATWTSVARRTLGDAPVTSIASDGKVLVAAGRGVARSTDKGKTWTAVTPGNSTSRVAATANGFIVIGDATSSTAVSRSTDGGKTWTTIGSVSKQNVYVNAVAAAGATAIAVGGDGVVLRSTDGGATWSSSVAGKLALAAVWHAGKAWWIAGDAASLFRSDDDGKTWSPIAGLAERIDIRAGWGNGSTTVLAGTLSSHGGRGDQAAPRGVIARSTDGKTWTTSDLPDHYQLDALAFAGNMLVVGGDHGAIARSLDAGKTWTAIPIRTIRPTPSVWTDGQTIVVGGEHGEIWVGR
jgi:photosystem II stability/assembly factor-like uncharacterized protein